ncbi:MAG: hypothetical protein HQL42_05925 [Alphaproteobacteria bacterium]|nr:hypothetical protein [Alphaproteobacteria bacterium]
MSNNYEHHELALADAMEKGYLVGNYRDSYCEYAIDSIAVHNNFSFDHDGMWIDVQGVRQIFNGFYSEKSVSGATKEDFSPYQLIWQIVLSTSSDILVLVKDLKEKTYGRDEVIHSFRRALESGRKVFILIEKPLAYGRQFIMTSLFLASLSEFIGVSLFVRTFSRSLRPRYIGEAVNFSSVDNFLISGSRMRYEPHFDGIDGFGFDSVDIAKVLTTRFVYYWERSQSIFGDVPSVIEFDVVRGAGGACLEYSGLVSMSYSFDGDDDLELLKCEISRLVSDAVSPVLGRVGMKWGLLTDHSGRICVKCDSEGELLRPCAENC